MPRILERLPDLQARHRWQERKLIEAALAAAGWRLGPAAKLLGVRHQYLRNLLERNVKHPGLWEQYQQRKTRGRPRKESI